MGLKLKNKVAVVTGGSAGIGLAAAELFVAEGSQVFITGRRQPELDEAVVRIGHNVAAVCCDTSNPTEIDQVYKQVKERAGHIDILFINARFYEDAGLIEITEKQFDETFNANVQGLFLVVQKALPMLSQGSSVVLIASMASVSGFKSFSVFDAIKAALSSFARSWVAELKGLGIRVNVINPGHFDTPGFSALMTVERKAAAIAKGGVRLIGHATGSGELAVFLASDALVARCGPQTH